MGPLTITSDGENITGVWFEGQKYLPNHLDEYIQKRDLDVFNKTIKWFDCYFKGEKPDFYVPIKPEGTSFRKIVWKMLCDIPYGRTMTYGEIAKEIANQRKIKKMSAQAIGGAIGHNPIAILIPCHRVIGSNGSMTGYAGGINKKEKLLKLEQI